MEAANADGDQLGVMTAVAHHGFALQYASAPSEHCTDNELNTVQLDAQHGQRRPHRRNARQRKLHFAAAPFQRGRYTMHKMDEMVSGPVRARGSWGSVKAATTTSSCNVK